MTPPLLSLLQLRNQKYNHSLVYSLLLHAPCLLHSLDQTTTLVNCNSSSTPACKVERDWGKKKKKTTHKHTGYTQFMTMSASGPRHHLTTTLYFVTLTFSWKTISHLLKLQIPLPSSILWLMSLLLSSLRLLKQSDKNFHSPHHIYSAPASTYSDESCTYLSRTNPFTCTFNPSLFAFKNLVPALLPCYIYPKFFTLLQHAYQHKNMLMLLLS